MPGKLSLRTSPHKWGRGQRSHRSRKRRLVSHMALLMCFVMSMFILDFWLTSVFCHASVQIRTSTMCHILYRVKIFFIEQKYSLSSKIFLDLMMFFGLRNTTPSLHVLNFAEIPNALCNWLMTLFPIRCCLINSPIIQHEHHPVTHQRKITSTCLVFFQWLYTRIAFREALKILFFVRNIS